MPVIGRHYGYISPYIGIDKKCFKILKLEYILFMGFTVLDSLLYFNLLYVVDTEIVTKVLFRSEERSKY